MAASASPFAFYSWLLGSDRGRSRILGRLSHEANDALDEFLELALRYEQREPATLQGFMAWLRATDIEIKRDMEISRDEVRVMTVHGAKGLEAPVVFLMDTTSTPLDNVRLSLIRFQSGADTTAPPDCVVWAGRKADDPVAVRQARQRMVDDIEHEYRRLLYVAMTRAAERLIIGGVQPGNRNDVPPSSWYKLVLDGLQDSALAERAIETRDGAVRRFTRPEDVFAPADAAQAPTQTQLLLPPHLAAREGASRLHRGSSCGGRRTATMTGHRLARGESRAGSAARPASRRARASPAAIAAGHRGRSTTRCCGPLPCPQRRRLDRGRSRRARRRRRSALIADPRFAALFAPGSRAEVPLVGRIARPGRTPLTVSGQIDRLIVDGRRNPDRRLQDQSRAAARACRRATGLPPAARPVPRPAAAALSRQGRARGAGLDRNA